MKNMFSALNGFELINGYRFSSVYFAGIGFGFNTEYYKAYADAKINNLPIYIHNRFNIYNKYKNSMSINLSLGKNLVLNSTHPIRPYDIYGGGYIGVGIGYKKYFKDLGAFIIDMDYEYKHYSFVNYHNQDNSNLIFLNLKIGFEFNYSPLN